MLCSEMARSAIGFWNCSYPSGPTGRGLSSVRDPRHLTFMSVLFVSFTLRKRRKAGTPRPVITSPATEGPGWVLSVFKTTPRAASTNRVGVIPEPTTMPTKTAVASHSPKPLFCSLMVGNDTGLVSVVPAEWPGHRRDLLRCEHERERPAQWMARITACGHESDRSRSQERPDPDLRVS
jgi:hypothetical protein